MNKELLKEATDKRKGILNISWEELNDKYNKPYKNGEALRCAIKKELKKNNELPTREDKVNQDIQEKLEDIELKEIELKKEKFKLQDQRRVYNNLIRETSRYENLKEELFKMVDKINKMKPLKIENNKFYINSENEGLLCLSDWHSGIATSNYFNEYNTDILYKRIEKLINRTIEYGRLHKISKLHIFNLSDLVNGLIHITTRISNMENIIEQTQLVAEILSNMLIVVAKEFEEVCFYTAIGNHERVSPNKKESLYDENFSLFIPWYLKARLKNISNIKIIDNNIDNGIINTNIAGNKIFGVHGDLDKINSVVQNLTLMLKEFPNYICMSHIHHHEEKEIQGVEVIVNSTLSGVDDYAKNLRLISKPSQKFMVFNIEGRLCTYNILL